MSSEIQPTGTALTYELACTDCAYETTVDGTAYDALDVAETHQDDHGITDHDHFVDFELSDTVE